MPQEKTKKIEPITFDQLLELAESDTEDAWQEIDRNLCRFTQAHTIKWVCSEGLMSESRGLQKLAIHIIECWSKNPYNGDGDDWFQKCDETTTADMEEKLRVLKKDPDLPLEEQLRILIGQCYRKVVVPEEEITALSEKVKLSKDAVISELYIELGELIESST